MLNWKESPHDQKVEAVKEFILQGYSASQIALQFDHATRNAVVGFCHRHKLDLGKNDGRPVLRLRKPRTPRQPQQKPEHVPAVETVDALPEPEPTGGVPFIELAANACKWPLWDRLPADAGMARYCGADIDGAGSYCPHHTARSTGRGTISERTAHKELLRHAV